MIGVTAVAREPGCFLLARRHLAGQDNLEGPLAQAAMAGGSSRVRRSDSSIDQPVEPVALPIQFLLQRDHLLPDAFPLPTSLRNDLASSLPLASSAADTLGVSSDSNPANAV